MRLIARSPAAAASSPGEAGVGTNPSNAVTLLPFPVTSATRFAQFRMRAGRPAGHKSSRCGDGWLDDWLVAGTQAFFSKLHPVSLAHGSSRLGDVSRR